MRTLSGSLALLAAGCLFPSFSDLQGGQGGEGQGGGGSNASSSSSTGLGGQGGGQAGSGGTGGAPGPCTLGPQQRGSKGLPNPGAPGRCIDEHEATWGEYAQFLDEVDSLALPSDVAAECDWKTAADSYLPHVALFSTWLSHPEYAVKPMQGLDWCDARVFCAWAGKELCGTKTGAAIDRTAPSWLLQTEWYTACLANGPNEDLPECFPPDEPDDIADNADADTCAGAIGMRHALSNVWEWESNCIPNMPEDGQPRTDWCNFRGQPAPTGDTAPCGWENPESPTGGAGGAGGGTFTAREFKGYKTGARCCYAAQP